MDSHASPHDCHKWKFGVPSPNPPMPNSHPNLTRFHPRAARCHTRHHQLGFGPNKLLLPSAAPRRCARPLHAAPRPPPALHSCLTHGMEPPKAVPSLKNISCVFFWIFFSSPCAHTYTTTPYTSQDLQPTITFLTFAPHRAPHSTIDQPIIHPSAPLRTLETA